MEAFYSAVKAAGWEDRAHSKFHWMVHFANHLESKHMLPGCLVQERKHRLLKRFGADTQNTRKFDDSMLRQMLVHDLTAMADTDWVAPGSPVLLRPCVATNKAREVLRHFFPREERFLTAAAANLRPGVCCRGDYALLQKRTPLQATHIWLHVEVAGDAWTLASPCILETEDSLRGWAAWRPQTTPRIVRTDEIGPSMTWCGSDQLIRTLIPYPYRR